MTFAFGAPVWLLLLAAVPAWWRWLRPRSAGFVVAFADERQHPVDEAAPTDALDLVPTVLRCTALALVVIALAQPQVTTVAEEPVTQGVAVAIAMDLSTSMWAQDMARNTSRLEAAKSTVRRFLEPRNDDVGLVTFAGESLTRVPLTHDGALVDAAVDDLEVGLLVDGTDIAGAIAAGTDLLREAPHHAKVLILVTDGAHNKAGLEPGLAARAAAAFGVKVFAVAIGREDARGTEGMETVLTQAARITDGRYFRATDVAALEAIYAEIDRLTSPSEQLVTRVEIVPLGWILIVGALSCLIGVVSLRGSRWGVLP